MRDFPSLTTLLIVSGTPSAFSCGKVVFAYDSKLMKFINDQGQLKNSEGLNERQFTDKEKKVKK